VAERTPLRFPGRHGLGSPLSTAAVVTYDRDWRFVRATDAALAIMQKTRAEVIGRCVWELYPTLADLDSGRAMRATAEDGQMRHLTAQSTRGPHEAATVTIRPVPGGVSVEFTVEAVEAKRWG
jgi:PAS domain-containing protein